LEANKKQGASTTHGILFASIHVDYFDSLLPDNGKPSERVGRKANSLTPHITGNGRVVTKGKYKSPSIN
jgi:hypothetical protein